MPGNDDLGNVSIGAREIYNLTLETKAAVERIGDRVGGLADDIRELKETDKDHDNRLRALEERRWPLSVIGTVAGLIVAIVTVLGFLLPLLLKH